MARAGHEDVNILESGRALTLMVFRAAVAAVAAGAGAMGAAAAGGGGVEAAQVWVAIGAAAAAFGGVIGVPQQAARTEAPTGEVEHMRRYPETTQLDIVTDASPDTRRGRRRDKGAGYEPL